MESINGISIIIPTLNEAVFLPKTLAAIEDRKSGQTALEVIVIDAGSHDNTLELAGQFNGVNTFQNKDFKGSKYLSLNYGASMACHNVFLFLDADSILPDNFDLKIKNCIQDGCIGGAFKLKHDKRNTLLWFIELLNTMRYSINHRFFGDQGVFCLKDSFLAVDGYPKMDIMESSFFCKKLKNTGKLKLINTYITSSSRRFYTNGIIKTFFFDFKIWVKTIFKLSVKREAEKYWN